MYYVVVLLILVVGNRKQSQHMPIEYSQDENLLALLQQTCYLACVTASPVFLCGTYAFLTCIWALPFCLVSPYPDVFSYQLAVTLLQTQINQSGKYTYHY